MICILEIVLSGLLGILIGYLVSILFVKDYSLKGVIKSIDRFFNPIYHKDNKKEYIWIAMSNGESDISWIKGDSNIEMIDIIQHAMKKHYFHNDTYFCIIPAAAFVLYADELSYEDRCKAYRDVRDAIREYKKYK